MSDDPQPPGDLSRTDFWVGEVYVRPATLTLEIGGEEQRVEPRVMEILVHLAERAGDTVWREDLRATLWDAHVTDDAINRAVWKLRRALGGHADMVETVSKRGYRLAAEVQPLGNEPELGSLRPWPPVGPPRPPRRPWLRAVTALLMLGLAGVIGLSLWRAWPTGEVASDDGGVAADPPPGAVPFTSLPGYESAASVARDGSRVVFAHFAKEGPDAFQWDLYSRPLHGGEPRRLTASPAHEMNPAVSPGGDRVAFVRLDEDTCGLFLADLDGGDEVPVGLDCGPPPGPTECCPKLAWRNETTLLVTRREAAALPARVYEVDLADGATRVLTDPPAQWLGDQALAVSPDGQEVALVRRRSPEIADLFVLTLPTRQVRQLTWQGYPISGVAWREDGRSLVFGWGRTGTFGLWQVAAAGGPPRPVATVGMNASGPAVGPGALLYEEWKSEINVWEVDLVASSAAPLLTSTRWDWRARPSPDGSRLAFVSNRDGNAEVWLAGRGGEQPRRLTSLGTQVASSPHWSPDGAELVIAVAGTGGIDLSLVDAATGGARPLVDDASDERAPVFSRDGQRVYFASNRSGVWNIWSVDRQGGDLRQWTREGGVAARESTDGRHLWFVRSGEPGLWRLPLGAGEPEAVAPDFSPASAEDWEVGAAGIYFARFDAAQTAWLWRLDPSTGRSVELARLEREDGPTELYAGSGLWVSADGTRVLLSSVDRSHSDLWLQRGES